MTEDDVLQHTTDKGERMKEIEKIKYIERIYQYQSIDIRIHTCIFDEMTAKNRRAPNPYLMFSHCSHNTHGYHEQWRVDVVVCVCALTFVFVMDG